VEPKIIGKGTAPTEAWELTTLEESSAVLGDMAIMIVATSTQDGMPTNGSTVTAGASGIMATKTGDGKKGSMARKARPRRRATPKAPRRARDAATREGMPLSVNVRDLHHHLVVHLLLLPCPLLLSTALVATPGSLML